MRTKEDNELEKQLIADLKKLDQLIKKTEKEEKQLEKLVNNERSRQMAMSDQQRAIQQKMEEQQIKIQQQAEQKRQLEILEEKERLESIQPNSSQVEVHTDTNPTAILDIIPQQVAPVEFKLTKRANHLVSEKIYELFSKCAASHELDENVFDEKVKNILKEATKDKDITMEIGFDKLTNCQTVYERYIDLISEVKSILNISQQIQIRKDFIDSDFGEKDIKYQAKASKLAKKAKRGPKTSVLEDAPDNIKRQKVDQESVVDAGPIAHQEVVKESDQKEDVPMEAQEEAMEVKEVITEAKQEEPEVVEEDVKMESAEKEEDKPDPSQSHHPQPEVEVKVSIKSAPTASKPLARISRAAKTVAAQKIVSKSKSPKPQPIAPVPQEKP